LEQKLNVLQIIAIRARHLGQDEVNGRWSKNRQFLQTHVESQAAVEPVRLQDYVEFAE